jgi:hypothetical protein
VALTVAASGLTGALAASACRNELGEARTRITPEYDQNTGKLRLLKYDANGNGTIDTWSYMDGARVIRIEIDSNEDGKIDRWEYYDQQGVLTKVGFSRSGAETPDAWAYSAPNGRVDRVEISSQADETKIDRWEHYDLEGPTRPDGFGRLLRAEADTNGDGIPDRWETYEDGQLAAVEFDENGDGVRDRRLTYKDGEVVLIETAPDTSGHYTKKVNSPS